MDSNAKDADIILIDAAPRVLGTYPEDLSENAAKTLARMGVKIRTGEAVTEIGDHRVVLSKNGRQEEIRAGTIMWSAGVKASPLGKRVSDKLGCETDKGGRITVAPDCSIPGHPEIFVIGDLAQYAHTKDRKPLPKSCWPPP